jgi:hypothetical protein
VIVDAPTKSVMVHTAVTNIDDPSVPIVPLWRGVLSSLR